MVSKTLQLLSLLPRDPLEFYDRVAAKVASRIDAAKTSRNVYRVSAPSTALSALEGVMGATLNEKLHEVELKELATILARRSARLNSEAPFHSSHNGGLLLARFCYAITRALRPKVIVETGVCYGITTAHFLCALKVNAEGNLHSIDLPPLGSNGHAHVGGLVPLELHNRWTLHRGAARRLLRPLLTILGEIDLFLHDSLHTYENMRAEMDAAWSALRPGGVLIADDVEGNAAFHQLAKRGDSAAAVVLKELSKESFFGVAVKGS
jgi:predicted O-methyltransferase YrrM